MIDNINGFEDMSDEDFFMYMKNLYGDLPQTFKKQFFDENNKVLEGSKCFLSFFNLLQNVFRKHFYDKTASRSLEQTWDTLNNPLPFIEEICSSFIDLFNTHVVKKLSGEHTSTFLQFFPDQFIHLLHKKYILTSMLTLPIAVISLNEHDRYIFYCRSVNDYSVDATEATERLLELVENFQKQLAEISKSLQKEWQDCALDAYNKQQMTKEMLDLFMGTITERGIERYENS